MRDYDLLAKTFRHCAEKRDCATCPMYVKERKCPDFEVRKLAADAIEELLAAVPKWNPVSDPPKENGRYYVAYEDSVSFLDYFNGKWFFPPRNGIIIEEIKESILCWIPLPAPPKEVE